MREGSGILFEIYSKSCLIWMILTVNIYGSIMTAPNGLVSAAPISCLLVHLHSHSTSGIHRTFSGDAFGTTHVTSYVSGCDIRYRTVRWGQSNASPSVRDCQLSNTSPRSSRDLSCRHHSPIGPGMLHGQRPVQQALRQL